MTPELEFALRELDGEHYELHGQVALASLAECFGAEPQSATDWPELQAELDCLRSDLEPDVDVVKEASTVYSDEWTIGFAQSFSSSVKSLPKNLKGRLMEALLQLAKAPSTPSGDTVKPLSGDLKGIWRYRIADYRIVYRPNMQKKEVQLLFIKPRDSVYD